MCLCVRGELHGGWGEGVALASFTGSQPSPSASIVVKTCVCSHISLFLCANEKLKRPSAQQLLSGATITCNLLAQQSQHSCFKEALEPFHP